MTKEQICVMRWPPDPPNTPCDPLPVIITNQMRGRGREGGTRWKRSILISTTPRRKDDTGSEVPVATEIDTDLNVIGSSSRLVSAKKAFFVFTFSLKFF